MILYRRKERRVNKLREKTREKSSLAQDRDFSSIPRRLSPAFSVPAAVIWRGKEGIPWDQVLEDIRYCLKQTDMSIKQICDRLGFPNPSFFGKYVKDHFGMTPIQLREKT